MRYEGRVFRPPSEAYSLIVQATVGCSHNKCKFCDMYREKQFHLRPLEDVLYDFDLAKRAYGRVSRIFLADGDALIRKTSDLLAILAHIQAVFPDVERVTSYASPRSLLLKSPEELTSLREAGLSMVYLGLESGSDTVLTMMNKGASASQIVEAGLKAKAAGMKLSVTAISGLGGLKYSEEHATDTAKAFSAMNPEYIGILTLMTEPLEEMIASGTFSVLSPLDVLKETHLLLTEINSEGSVFRMNHASNYLNLRGTLNYDTPRMLFELESAIQGHSRLKSEFLRGF